MVTALLPYEKGARNSIHVHFKYNLRKRKGDAGHPTVQSRGNTKFAQENFCVPEFLHYKNCLENIRFIRFFAYNSDE